MAPAAAPLLSPSGHQIIAQYLAPKALRGDTTTDPDDLVADDVDVFSAESPAALPFHPGSRTDHGEVWGYFFGDYPIDDVRPVPGGCWARYGPEKEYVYGHGRGGAMEAVAFRRSFAFHETCWGDDGGVVVLATPWLMKEYRLNKRAAAFRAVAKRPGPKANMDCVVRKIFAKSPPPPPASPEQAIPASSYMDEEAGYSSDEDWKRVGCRIEEEPGRKRGRFCVV